nr:hypothetical protein I308_04362 [Cryptococcus tetragattii IND107]
MQFRTYINHRINLESSKAPNQSLSSSSGEEHNVAAPNLSSARLSDDISIPRHSPPVGQSPSLPDYACPLSPTGQEVSHSSLERTLWISMMGKAMVTFLSSWRMILFSKQELRAMEMQVLFSLIPSYSGRQPHPYRDGPIFRTGPATRSMPLLTTVLAVLSVFLTTFVGVPQRLGDMVKAVIQIILELAIAEDRQALRRRVSDDRNLSPDMREKIHDILNLPFETSSSRFRKNVKTLYAQLDIDPSMAIHPKCPTTECQNVFIDVVDKDGWDKIPDNYPECGTALREGGRLVTEFFPRPTLQAELEFGVPLLSWWCRTACGGSTNLALSTKAT